MNTATKLYLKCHYYKGITLTIPLIDKGNVNVAFIFFYQYSHVEKSVKPLPQIKLGSYSPDLKPLILNDDRCLRMKTTHMRLRAAQARGHAWTKCV